MKVAVSDHQNKARYLIQALERAGHDVVPREKPADVLLIDFDGPVGHYARVVEMQYSYGAQIFLYQHGAAPMVAYDGIWEPSDKVRGYFAQSEGAKRVMESYGYPHPIHVIGWYYCPTQPFHKPETVQNVLFAPWHPHANDYLHPTRRDINRQIYEQLLEITNQLTVRHIRPLHANGLWEVDHVDYVKAVPDNALEDIDAADLVVAEGTFAYLAIARGKPTVMFGQDVIPLDGYADDNITYVKNWDTYKHAMSYPYDAADGLAIAMSHAVKFEPKDWKKRFIGEQMDPLAFVEKLELLTIEALEAQYA